MKKPAIFALSGVVMTFCAQNGNTIAQKVLNKNGYPDYRVDGA